MEFKYVLGDSPVPARQPSLRSPDLRRMEIGGEVALPDRGDEGEPRSG